MIINNKCLVVYFLAFFTIGFAQNNETAKDTIAIKELDEVVVTGQINPQSVKESVFEVNVISKTQIEQMAVNNIADVLNQSLNINISVNASSGKSGASLFGLDAQYFKVLIDNIPVINEEGFGNNTDLTQLNIDDIERIEIVEGAMGVQYGSNSVSGVINIITKKSSDYKTQVSLVAQEETVGSEYDLKSKGRHIQNIKLSHNLSEKIFASASYFRNEFNGYWGNKQGQYYDKNDELRGHDWLPKEQNSIKALIRYKGLKHTLFYKLEQQNENIEDYNSIVNLNENPSTGTQNPIAKDRIFTNTRWYHHLNANGKLVRKSFYDISISYQSQVKNIEEYTSEIRNSRKSGITKGEYLSREAFFSRGTFNNLVYAPSFILQAGYEVTLENGFGSGSARLISSNNSVTQSLNYTDIFTTSEIKLSDRFRAIPGARVSTTNQFDNQYVFSLTTKYTFKNELEVRAVVGSANRTPNYDELYTFFVDVNHNVQGNLQLRPEKGISAFLHFKKAYKISGDLMSKNKISFSYLGLKDRIELILINLTPQEFKYDNIDSFQSISAFTENTFYYKNFKLQLGVSVLGVSKVLDRATSTNDDFLFSMQANSSINYSIPKSKVSFSLYYKHVGKQYQFVQKTNANGDEEFVRGTTGAFSWLDFSARKTFFEKKQITTIGVRNLLDVTQVETTAFGGGTHNGPPASLFLGYGRSFFIKLNYNLNI